MEAGSDRFTVVVIRGITGDDVSDSFHVQIHHDLRQAASPSTRPMHNVWARRHFGGLLFGARISGSLRLLFPYLSSQNRSDNALVAHRGPWLAIAAAKRRIGPFYW